MTKTLVMDCPEHGPDCAVIVHADDDDFVLWASHAPATTHVECRLGEQTPEATDLRHQNKKRPWLPTCDDCADHFGMTPEHRAAAVAAAKKAKVHP